MVLRFRDHILNNMRMRLEGAEKLAEKTRTRIQHLEAERRRLLQAHLSGAVPLELLKEEQNRTTRQLAQAGAELVNTEVDWENVEHNVNAAVKLASELSDIYLEADPTMRRRINQASWEGFDVDADGVVGSRLTDPMAAIVADDLIKCLSTSHENRDPFSGGRGSRLSSLVEVIARLSNSSDLGKRVQKVLEIPASVAFRTKTRTPRRAQRRLTDQQLKELLTGYEQGRPIDELAAQFGIHRSTVLDHLNRSHAPRRYPALDEDRIKLAIERYQDGLSLRDVGITLGVHASTIRQALLQNRIPIRDQHRQER